MVGRAGRTAISEYLPGMIRDWALDLVVVNGNPLDDIAILADPARVELVLKGGAVCADRRAGRG